MTRLGYEAQVRLVFDAAVRDARKLLRNHFKEHPHIVPPPLIAHATSAHALCVMRFTFREDEDGIPLHSNPSDLNLLKPTGGVEDGS